MAGNSVLPAPERANQSVIPTASKNCTTPRIRRATSPISITSRSLVKISKMGRGNRRKSIPMVPMKMTDQRTDSSMLTAALSESSSPSAFPTSVAHATPKPMAGRNDAMARVKTTSVAATSTVPIIPIILKKST